MTDTTLVQFMLKQITKSQRCGPVLLREEKNPTSEPSSVNILTCSCAVMLASTAPPVRWALPVTFSYLTKDKLP